MVEIIVNENFEDGAEGLFDNIGKGNFESSGLGVEKRMGAMKRIFQDWEVL